MTKTLKQYLSLRGLLAKKLKEKKREIKAINKLLLDFPKGDLDFTNENMDAFKDNWNATHKKPEEKFEANPWLWVVSKALKIIRELQKELQQSSISNVYWELCYNKDKEAHKKLKSKLVQFSEENYKKNQKGYYRCNCYSEIDGILEDESK